jgi:hypothetical protein
MSPAALLLLNFRWVAHFNALFFIQHYNSVSLNFKIRSVHIAGIHEEELNKGKQKLLNKKRKHVDK